MDQLGSCGLLISVCVLVLSCKAPILLHNFISSPYLCAEQVPPVRDTAAALEGLTALSCDWPEAGRGRVWVTGSASLCSFVLCMVLRATFPLLCLCLFIYLSFLFTHPLICLLTNFIGSAYRHQSVCQLSTCLVFTD